jgi:hypothetical protein
MIFQSNKNFLLFCWFCCWLSACANVVGLEGGDKDTVPPKLDSLRSTRNFQTKFKKQPIELTFNEWVKFDDPNQVVVSPPLEKKPSIQLKGKTIKFKFDDAEVLRENATYTINFGESIKDLTEGNKTKARFVFSTGEMIDSLTAKFNVYDALNSQPTENVLVLLYENLQDSVVSKERPFYFGKTDKDGNCTIENVKKGLFKAFVLNDANLNFKYDLPTEKIGFLSKPIEIGKDSAKINSISFFEPQLPIRIKEKNANIYGQVKLVFSQNALAVKPTWEKNGQKVNLEYNTDTLRIWYQQDTPDAWKLFVLKDTIDIKPSSKESFLAKNKLQLVGGDGSRKRGVKSIATQSQNIAFSKPLNLNFNFPISIVDTSKITIQDDTTKKVLYKFAFQMDSINLRKVSFNGNWQENHTYTLRALPGTFIDIFGQKNDTLEIKMAIQPKKDFGDIVLKYSELAVQNQYILQLVNTNGEVVEKRVLSNTKEGTLNFFLLSPKVYALKIITDSNRNGRWDSGNYYEKRQPEPIFSKKLEELKPNWTLETEVNFK